MKKKLLWLTCAAALICGCARAEQNAKEKSAPSAGYEATEEQRLQSRDKLLTRQLWEKNAAELEAAARQRAEREAMEKERLSRRLAREKAELEEAARQVREKFAEIAPSTRLSRRELYADDGDYSRVEEYPPVGTYSIQVDVTNRIMRVFDSDGRVVRMMLCTVGASETPTPIGRFKMGSSRRRFAMFSKFDCYAQYWSQVRGGIYIHSILYEKRDDSTLIKSSLRNLGRSGSHGCIRLSVPDARWVYKNVAPGSICEVARFKRNDALRRSLALRV